MNIFRCAWNFHCSVILENSRVTFLPPRSKSTIVAYNNNNNNNNNRKNDAYVINLDEYRDIGTHWVALYVNNKTIKYFDSFGVEHIPKEIMKFIGNKKIITNIFRIQAYDSIMCGYFYIGFINSMFNGNRLTDYTSFFSPNDLKKTMI